MGGGGELQLLDCKNHELKEIKVAECTDKYAEFLLRLLCHFLNCFKWT